MSLTEPKEQSGNEKIDNNKDIRVSAVRGRKITITTISVILASRKLSITSIKMTLPEGMQDVRVKKVWIETTSQ